MEDNSKRVLDTMKQAGKPMRPGEIAELANIEKAEVSKLIQNLKKEGKVVSPKRCFWEPST